MEDRTVMSWQAKEYDFQPKEHSWYWAVGIVAAGIATAAFIVGDYLFSVIAVLGGFTVMLMGSKRPKRHTFRITERGLKIGDKLIAYKDMERFAIHDEEPMMLIIETKTLSGTISVPLGHADYRAIEVELKNQNVEEVERLGTFIEKVATGMGLGSF